jgi:ParB-like chromosome segregation protein Spo0J
MLNELKKLYDESPDKVSFTNEMKAFLHDLSPMKHNPVDLVKWIHVDQVQANDYNPNSVAKNEMRLLYTSVSHDGYTQPIVTIFDEALKKYIIVDGFHRFSILKNNKDIYDMNNGLLPVVVLDKNINDRMASTIRHNRARGKHNVTGMSNIVFNMLMNGWKDEDILKELGMEGEELIRLKHITGYSKLYENHDYGPAWKTDKIIKLEKQYIDEHPEDPGLI